MQINPSYTWSSLESKVTCCKLTNNPAAFHLFLASYQAYVLIVDRKTYCESLKGTSAVIFGLSVKCFSKVIMECLSSEDPRFNCSPVTFVYLPRFFSTVLGAQVNVACGGKKKKPQKAL